METDGKGKVAGTKWEKMERKRKKRGIENREGRKGGGGEEMNTKEEKGKQKGKNWKRKESEWNVGWGKVKEKGKGVRWKKGRGKEGEGKDEETKRGEVAYSFPGWMS